jgi:alcohol dehydrogenase YqhD (iron-dependent ADH family)
LKTCIKYCPIALKEPDNYEARANLMWASSMGLNSLLTVGKGGGWSCHPIEHELSAYYDVTHGEGLAIVTPRWMEYILREETMARFCKYARNVWGLAGDDSMELAKAGIDKTYQFFVECGIPMTLPEIGVDGSKLREMAEHAIRNDRLAGAYVPMNADDVEKILQMCM